MQYILYILLIAVVFGLIALGDKLLQLIFPKNSTEKQGKAVRMPRYSLILGVLMSVLAVVLLLFLPENTEFFAELESTPYGTAAKSAAMTPDTHLPCSCKDFHNRPTPFSTLSATRSPNRIS